MGYVFGRRKDEVFLKLKKLLEPFGIKHYCTDGLGVYRRHLPEERHKIGKKKIQRIEQKHIRLRTRIKRLQRKTICFSKTEEMKVAPPLIGWSYLLDVKFNCCDHLAKNGNINYDKFLISIY